MSKIKLSMLRFIPIILPIKREFELTIQQAFIYGYIFNHCMNINDDGYCGYSDERMARELSIGYDRFKKELAVLRKKNLIITQNPGRRTKQAGLSRMIWINTEVYLDEQQINLQDVEIENLLKENERLKKQLQEALQTQIQTHPNHWLQMIVNAGIIPEQDLQRACEVLNSAYESFALDFGYTETKKHITYMINALVGKKVTEDLSFPAHHEIHTDVVQYLAAALDQRFDQLHHWRNMP